MGFNIYISEQDWAFREAELTRELEKRRMVKEAKATQKAAGKNRLQTGNNSTESVPVKKVGKENLEWN
jgi:hypothetical protein